MSTKDLFNKGNKVLTKSQEEKIKSDLESPELARDIVRANNKFQSHIDFSNPENFSFYGSAERYYEDSFNRIYQTYPYDGSQSEKEKWLYDSSELDLWILDNAYPKATGYVRLGTEQSVFVKGGPNKQSGVVEGEKEELSKQFPVKQGNSNIWDTSIYRNSNLYLDAELGNTIEFWAKMDNPALSVYPFVIGNVNSTRISFNHLGGILGFEYTDDTSTGISTTTGIVDFIETTWNHYAFTFINDGANVKIEIYKNGSLVETLTGGSALSDISQEELYLNINGTMTAVDGTRSNTVDGLYIDEFRFWKRRRTEEEISRYWFTHIHGGTNTDDNKYNTENRKVDIGVYYKFNEGVTGNHNIDSTVLDYSGRISNGEIINYNQSVRSTSSAIDESGFFDVAEEKEPIIYSAHPDFVSTKQTYMQEGLNYDYTNNSSIYHTMPAWIIEEDEEKGENVKELSQVISSYFDSAQIKIKELVNLKDVEYHTLEERTNKPYSLIRRTLESAGMVVPDLFTEASAFEEILSRGEQEKFEEKLQDVKNTIYQNIYNNLSYIYKSKGTEKAFRNLIRCFGIDDELVKINLYSDGADYTLEDTRRTTAIKKKFVDFNNADREEGLVYTKEDPSNADSISYLRGIGNGIEPNLSFTFETEVIFPKRLPLDHPEYDAPTNLEEHIAFMGKYMGGYTTTEFFDLRAVKENSDALSENVKFVLDFYGQTLETGYFKSVYENSKWNIAVRMVPEKAVSSIVQGGDTTDYKVELYCVRMLADVVEDEELVTQNITPADATVLEADARTILNNDKFISVGALHSSGDPETYSLDNDTRLKISSTLFWYDNVTDEEIRAHGSDASNFGRLHPSEEAYMFDENFNTGDSEAIQVQRRDTLAMHWDFSEITTTDGSGEFIVDDLSGGVELEEIPINENSIHFDGVDDRILVGDHDIFTFTDGITDTPFSMSAWIYVGDVSADNGTIIGKFNPNANNEWMFKQEFGKLAFYMYSGAGTSIQKRIIANSVSLSDNTWHHVVVTCAGGLGSPGYTLYTDAAVTAGTQAFLNSYAGTANTAAPLTIGSADLGSGNRIFEDRIADVVIFNKELSAAEVTEIYNGYAVKNMDDFSDVGSIISWWKMGDDQDTSGSGGIIDYVGGYNGTLENGASIQAEPTLDSDTVTSGRFGWFTKLVGYEVTGRGKHFGIDDTQIVNREYVYSAKHRAPEVINSEDLVEIRTQDDLTFTKDAQVVTHFFAAEKSMYQVISDDMINLFATIVEFNDLIGQPVNRYRLQYKALEKFRARYFEKVSNVPSLEKYIELYKWIDSSIGLMLQELIPVSSNFSADLRNMVESHVLERNKYWTKFPTLEMSGEPPLGIVRGINELAYNWKDGHAPVGAETIEDDKFLWGDQRVQGTDALVTTGDSDVDDNREVLRRVATRTTQGNIQVVDRGVYPAENFVEEDKPILRDNTGAVYSGQAYVTRALAKPYKLNLDIAKTIHGGANYSPTTKDPNAFIRAATRIIPGADTVGIEVASADNPVTYEEWKKKYTVKRSVTVTIEDTELNLTQGFDGDVVYPYYGEDFRDASPYITGHHNDSYGDDAEIALQSPFTETWVGGNQHRHVPAFAGIEFIGSASFVRGSNNEIIIPHNDSYSFTDNAGQDYSAAISFWIKPNHSLVAAHYVMSKFTSSSSVREWYIYLFQDRLYFTAFDITTGNNYEFNTSIAAVDENSDTWHHVVINFKASTVANSHEVEFWVDNALIDSETESNLYNAMSITSAPITIGSLYDNYSGGTTSEMRDVAIFNFQDQSAALSSDDIAALYENNIENHPRKDKLVGWWKLYEDATASVGTDGVADAGVVFNPEIIATDRPELYVDDAGIFKHPHEVDPYRPAARWTRDELAKRPINIENIKTVDAPPLGTQPHGNYTRDYEIVQTSGRTKNNNWFIDNEGVLPSTYTESPYITGVFDYELPDRGRTEHVFVERFSAPGDSLTLSRGYLDTIAEEFSVYNSMNFRNLDERLDNNRRLYTHSDKYQGSQGYEDSVSGIPSIHKVNRNSFLRPLETGCKTTYDNAYVSHQIPRSDLQYAFVTASIDYSQYRGGTNPYPDGHCGTDTIPVRFGGYYDSVHIVKGDEGYDATYADYQGAGYRFIRNAENSQVITQRKTNTYSQLNRTPALGTEDRSVSTFVEPAVVWNKPNTHYVLNEEYTRLAAQGETLKDLRKNVNPITYSYSNNLEMFSNEELTRAVDIDKTSKSEFSETLMAIFKKAELLFSRSIAREIVYPKHKNVGLKKTRFRSEFDTYKFFWKDKMFDRIKCSNTTKLGYEMTDEFKALFKQKFSVDVVDSIHFSQSSSTEQEFYKVIGDLSYIGEDRTRYMITRKDLDITDTEHPLYGSGSTVSFTGLEELCEAEATVSGIVPVYSSVEIERQKRAPIPSPQLYHNPYNEDYKESEGWINRKPITSGNKPTYNDYDSFSEEVKLAAQNYGLVSEFRISEHMDKYILENGGNFRAKNYDFLTLDGASYDGENHTRTSGIGVEETSSFYSIKKEDSSLALTAYPTSSSDNTLVKNNAEGYFGYNPIYTLSNSTFGIENSVNSEIEINEANKTNYVAVVPYQSGTNAAGKFGLDTSNDYLLVDIDKPNADGTSIAGFVPYPNATHDDMPLAISIWAQPENVASAASYGLWSSGFFSGERSINLFSHYYLYNGATGYQNLGITFVVSDGTGTPDDGMPVTTLGTTSSVYTFFKQDGTLAIPEEGKMNNIILQLIPPSYDLGLSVNPANYLIKAWLNGEELYGVNAVEFTSSVYSGRGGANPEINGYSPCPIGQWLGGGDYPWTTNYDTSFSNSNLKGLLTLNKFVIGNCNYHQSRDNSAATQYRFVGLLDEFTIFRGILPAPSIATIYNNGLPNNVNELIPNNQVSGNCLYDGTQTIYIPSLGFITIPTTSDSGEFDFGEHIEILSGTAVSPNTVDFEDNYSKEIQQEIEATLPVWHRIGVPSYDAIVRQDGWDSDFFNSYVHTDNLNFIEKADKKHDELGVDTVEKVKLKVNAIKKLLPYEGFYPQDRTVQLANLFVEKISPDIIHDEKVYKEQAVQAALQHFFAPGILYNSIKAGIACDWASYTNESGLEPVVFGDSVVIYNQISGRPEVYYSKKMAPHWYTNDSTYTANNVLQPTEPTDVDGTIVSSPANDFIYSSDGVINTGTGTYDVDIKSLVISQVPTKRLPFESILDPYSALLDGRNNERYDAETSGTYDDYDVSRKPNQHFLMNPSYYEGILKYDTDLLGTPVYTVDEPNSNYKNFVYPYFEINSNSANKDFRYELAINNFVSEATKFFIKEEKLSSFSSSIPQGEGYYMESGSTYYMDVVLSKSSDFSIINSPDSLGGRYFGPPSKWINFYSSEIQKVQDPAYAPYAPSYFYGETVTRISFSSGESRKYTLGEIFKLSATEDVSPQKENYFSIRALDSTKVDGNGNAKDSDEGAFRTQVSYQARMPLSASIELFGKTSLSRQEFDEEGNPVAISTANNEELDTWVIYTKFECPLFDFSDSSNASDEGTLSTLGITTDTAETVSTDNYEYTSSYLDTQNTERWTTDKRTGSGIWAGYGRQQDGKGVTVSIRESFPRNTDPNVGSLIEVCGFTPETKQIGRVADSKEISEAVLMIPFLDEPITTEQRLFGGESRQVYATVNVDDRNFIAINNLEYRKQKRDFDKNRVIYTTETGEEVRQTSITNMIEGMRNYNVPPLYDFETYGEKPFAMYFFEFKHTLDRDDLSNIWQGLQPKIAKEASLDSVEVSHEINEHELFGNLGEIPEGVRWMVFKVKKKAEKSYYNLTEDSRDDSRFKFDFEVGTKEPEYGYNYPYDYFTMLEMIQVEANAEKEIDPVEQHRKRKGESE